MLLFLEEQQHFIISEIAEAKMAVLGTCVTMLNADKAKVIIGHSRKKKRTPEEEHTLFVELSSKYSDHRLLVQDWNGNLFKGSERCR